MRERNPAIPAGAAKEKSFDIGGGGDHPAQAVVLDFAGGRVWASSLDFPDEAVVGRTWVTEITVGEHGGRVQFGARLLNVTRRFDAPFLPTVPSVVRGLIGKLDALADGVKLADRSGIVQTEAEFEDFVALVEDPARQLPVVALSSAADRGSFAAPNAVARRLAGAAHVFDLTSDAAWELTRRFGRSLSVFDGAARLYRPGFQSDSADPFDHPRWIPRAGSAAKSRADLIVSRVLALSVSSGSNRDYPRFNVIRQAVAADAIRVRRDSTTDTDLVRLFEEENARLEGELTTLRAEFDQWLEEAEATTNESERVTAELRAQIARVRAHNDVLQAAAAAQDRAPDVAAPLNSYFDFEDWIAANLSPNVWIAPKAMKEIAKHAEFDDPELIGRALSALDRIYVPMRRNPGDGHRQIYEKALADMGCSDQPCFSDRNAIKAFPEYSVTYLGEKYWCDNHIKYGGGTDPRRHFRIYYHWHEDERVLLIGHLPTHLDNKLTN